MIDNAFKIAIDPLFPHPKRNWDALHENRFDLVFSDFGQEKRYNDIVSDEDDPESDEDA
jgi:hypothetical protein